MIRPDNVWQFWWFVFAPSGVCVGFFPNYNCVDEWITVLEGYESLALMEQGEYDVKSYLGDGKWADMNTFEINTKGLDISKYFWYNDITEQESEENGNE